MKIKARIAVVVDAQPVVSEGEFDLPVGATVKKFMKKADKALGFKKPKPFRDTLKQGLPPTILLNGDRLDLPEGWKHKLTDGDEVTVLTPMMGG
jgi:molybdopterin converting factor small subunit